jgi:hypothetical protein
VVKETPNDILEINERLNKSPFNEKRIPSSERISMIQNSVKRGKRRNNKSLWTAAGAVLVCLIVLFTLSYVNEMPGGFADQRMSQAIGLEGANKIPFGRTPEEAIQKLRNYTDRQIIHKEPVDGGTLLFIKREYQKDGTDLEIDYLRKTWLGWKWTWGGMFGHGSSIEGVKSVLSYMFMPKLSGINTPFPIVFGDVLDPTVNSIIIIENSANPMKYSAKLAGSQTGHTIWFAYLPTSFTVPYEIQALNVNGDIVVSKTINEPNDSGLIQLPIK